MTASSFWRAARGLLVSGAATCALGITSVAHASDDAIPLRLVVHDSELLSCADTFALLDEVRIVEPRVQASDLESAPRAEVFFRTRVAGGFRGELTFEHPASARVTRIAEGNNCADVARALAIVIALQASAVPERSAPTPPSMAPVPVPPAQPSSAPAPDEDTKSPRIARRGSFGIAEHEWLAGAGFRSGIVSDRMSPFAHVGYALVARGLGLGTFSSRVGAHFGQDTTELTVVRLFTGGLDLCPINLGERERLTLAFCVRGELGTKNVAARYRGNYDASSWAALGSIVSLHARVVGGLTIQLDAGALATLARTRFRVWSPEFGSELGRIEPDSTKTALMASIGLGWSFTSDFGGSRR